MGILPTNAISHKLVDLELNLEWLGSSLRELSLKCPLSLSTLNRLKIDKAGIKITKKYKLTW